MPVRHFLRMQPGALQGFLPACNGMRLISRLPRALFTAGTGEVPEEPSDEPVCDWVSVSAAARRLAATAVRGSGYFRMTTTAALVQADAVHRSAAAGELPRGVPRAGAGAAGGRYGPTQNASSTGDGEPSGRVSRSPPETC